MLDDKNTATTFTYTVNGATIAASGTAASGNVDIGNWGVDTEIGGKKLGDSVATAWIITFNAATASSDASLAGISGTFPA